MPAPPPLSDPATLKAMGIVRWALMCDVPDRLGRFSLFTPDAEPIIDPMFSQIRSVHFVGICGTAMASTAAALQEKGVRVTGSDQNVYPPMSTFLAERKIEVISGYAEPNLSRRPDLVVIGNAISRGNPEAEYVLDHKLPYCSLPELLKHFFIRGKRSLVVAGTHGKTTTTALLTWVFEHNGLNPNYLIGGIPNNLHQG